MLEGREFFRGENMHFIKVLIILSLVLHFSFSTQAEEIVISANEAQEDLKWLEKLVNISSDTLDIAGVNQVLEEVEAKALVLAPNLKTYRLINKQIDPNTNQPAFADSLVLELPGSSQKFITLVTHADTVFPAKDGKVATPFTYVDGGQKIMGSGVGDCKGGIVMALRIFHYYADKQLPYSLRLIVAGNEEFGSPGHRESYEELSKDSIAILGLEPSWLGNILHGRGGVHWYEVKITGKEAHAGAAHEAGVNACVDLAEKLVEFSELTDYEEKVKINVGVIQGGVKPNTVCGEATAKIDTRFATAEQNDIIKELAEYLFTKPKQHSHDGQNVPTVGTVTDLLYMPAFNPDRQAIQPYMDLFLAKVNQLEGSQYGSEWTGAGADVSYMVGTTDIMLDSLGPVTEFSHTHDEYIFTSTVKTRTEALISLIDEILKK